MTAGAHLKVTWRDKEYTRNLENKLVPKLNRAAIIGVQFVQVVSPRDTGFMANTMTVIKQATVNDLSVVWGNQTANYTLWVEIGAQGRPGVHMLRRSLEPASKEFYGTR